MGSKSGSNLALGGVKTQSDMDRRIIYSSLIIVIVLALLTHQSANTTYSLATVLLIIFIVIGNIIYLHRKYKK